MKLPIDPSPDDLRAWANDPDASPLKGDWELVLTWDMEPGRLRACIELAETHTNPHFVFFRQVLLEWVCQAVRSPEFAQRRQLYDAWLDQAKGIRDPWLKNWRHTAKLIFKGLEPYDNASWWARLQE